MTELDPSGLNRILSETRRILESTPKRTADGTGNLPTAMCEGADGKLKVTASLVGSRPRLTDVELDPRILRMPAAEIAQTIMDTVNACLTEVMQEAAALDELPLVDTKAVADQVGQLQQEAMREMQVLFSGIGEAMRKIEQMAREAQR
ncbi:hypothetical protein [Actinoallomurus rhizosphaericola]|uniref:hypothetical protein n=1 Tax=Actinoallomurus rhizosphaericola TaxID=2952536 RepID=UPI00209252C2|nr:hypothetical protein [Actinoallomurus rhizosphaericola]MCO5996115.1 hypothetical protein [Actinoallomurus rhizosphaericola]